MSPDTNAYVAIPMDGMGIMSSSAAPVRRRRSCGIEAWLLGGVIAIVLLMLGVPLVMSRCRHSHHMMMGQNHMYGGWHEQKHHPYGSDTIVMVIDEEPALDDDFHGEGLLDEEGSPDDDMLSVTDGSVTMNKGQPIVLVQEHGKIVEKYVEDPSDDVWFLEPNDEAINDDYEDERYQVIEFDEEDPNDEAIYDDDDYEDDQVIDEYVNVYEEEQPDEGVINDEVIYVYEEEMSDEAIDEWLANAESSAESFDDAIYESSSDSSSSSSSDSRSSSSSDSRSSSSSSDEEYNVEELPEVADSVDELEEPIEELEEAEVVAVERMGGN